MPITCRYLALSQPDVDLLVQDPGILTGLIEAKPSGSLSYYWHGIEFLLERFEAPTYVRCLRSGGQELPTALGLPATRLHTADEVKKIAAAMAEIGKHADDLEDLSEEYDAEAMDAAGVYPNNWVVLEDEDYQEYGEMIELASEMWAAFQQAAKTDQAILVYFESLEDELGF